VLVVPKFDDAVVPFRPILTISDDDADEIVAAVRRGLG
jgi:4-aminobutyrate aminotransferase-like enzyme